MSYLRVSGDQELSLHCRGRVEWRIDRVRIGETELRQIARQESYGAIQQTVAP